MDYRSDKAGQRSSLSHWLGYLDDAERECLAALLGEVARALQGLIRYWERESASGRAEIDRS